MQVLLALAVGYLAGAIPTAYILARVTKHVDIRKVGSGNVGGSNVAAQVGLLPSVATLLFDLVKGALVVAILRRYDFPLEAQVLAGVAAVLVPRSEILDSLRLSTGTPLAFRAVQSLI